MPGFFIKLGPVLEAGLLRQVLTPPSLCCFPAGVRGPRCPKLSGQASLAKGKDMPVSRLLVEVSRELTRPPFITDRKTPGHEDSGSPRMIFLEDCLVD